MKRISLLLITLAVISLQGCVTITTGIDGDEAIGFENGVPVTSDHAMFEAVEVGEAKGFSGTSPIIMTGDVSPDMSNEGVKEALESTLAKANMLSPENAGKYTLNATFVKNNEEGVWGGGLFFVDMNRKTTVNYQLLDKKDNEVIYNENIKSEGGEVHIRGFSLKGLYFKEKETAVPSYKNNFTQIANELKKVE